MKAVNYLIVSLEESYNNEVKISDKDSLIVNSTIENVEYINRVAKIVSAPDFTILESGDEVVVHHNIFRLRNNTKGNIVHSDFHIEGNLYFVPLTEVFMYRRGEDWEVLDPYCFVEPIKKVVEGEFTLNLSEDSYKGREERIGVIKYVNKELERQGIKSGDKVKFTENSEYEFNIDGTLYYKMSTKDIVAVL